MEAKRCLAYIYFILAVGLTVTLMACGGGGGGGSTPPPDTSAAAGFWYGTSTDQNNNTYSFGGIISADGQLRFMIDEGVCFGTQFKGTFSMDGDSGSGTFTGFAGGACEFSTGKTLINGTIDFDITRNESVMIDGTFSSQEYFGTFSLTYDPQAENTITLAELAGTWIVEEGDLSEIIVSEDGSFTGTDDSGCNLTGQISIIDPNWSITKISATASECDDTDHNGTYSGLGLWHFAGEREIFAVVVSSSTTAAFGFFVQTSGEISLSHPYIFSENASFSGLAPSYIPYYVMKTQITSDSSTQSILIQNNTVNELIPYSPILDLLSMPYFTYMKRFSPIPPYDPPGTAWEGMDYFFVADTNGNSMMDPDEDYMVCSVPVGAFNPMDIPLVSITGTNFPTISWRAVAGADSYVINFFTLTTENILGDLVFTIKIKEMGSPSYNYTYTGNLFDLYPTLAVMLVTKDNDNSCYYNRSVYATTHYSGI